MTSVVKEIVTAQKDSDKLFLEHEEKRKKFEAEQRCEELREFQLQWMSMLFGGQGCSPPTPQFAPPQPDQYGPYGWFPGSSYTGSGYDTQ